MGVATALVGRATLITPTSRLFLATGFCGGLTTVELCIQQ